MNITNITDPTKFAQSANDGTGGTFWVATMYMLYVVLIGVMAGRFGFLRAVISASVITIIISLPLVFLDLINLLWLGPVIGFMLLVILYTAYLNRQ